MKRRKLTFRTPTMIALILFTGCLLLSARYLFWSGQKHQEEYSRILTTIENKSPSSNNHRPKVRQSRQNVNKDLLINTKGRRLEMRIVSKKSDLFLESKRGKTDVVEHMKDVHCYMQEEVLDDPEKQIVRCFNSDDAEYSYKNDHFTANKVDMTRSLYSGTTLNSMGKKPEHLMEGIAESVEFSPAGKNESFKAKKLKAVLHSPRSLL